MFKKATRLFISHQIKGILEEACDLKVNLKIDKKQNVIELEALSDDAEKLKRQVDAELLKLHIKSTTSSMFYCHAHSMLV